MKRPIFSNRSAQKMWDYLASRRLLYETWPKSNRVVAILDQNLFALMWVQDTFKGRNPKYKKKHAKDTKKA